jgi:adenylate kinase family enzyme
MKKILIFGNSGSGKTTLANQLSDKFSLTHLDLDILAWLDTQPPARKPLAESIKIMDDFLSQHDNWVIEGCYADLLSYVSKKANEIIFLNPGIDVCISHCENRPWEPHKYKSKEEQDENLDMLIEWIKQYNKRDDEFSLKAHQTLFNSFKGIKKEIQDDGF